MCHNQNYLGVYAQFTFTPVLLQELIWLEIAREKS